MNPSVNIVKTLIILKEILFVSFEVVSVYLEALSFVKNTCTETVIGFGAFVK